MLGAIGPPYPWDLIRELNQPTMEKYNIKKKMAGCQWLTPVIQASQETEIRRISVGSQPEKIVPETLP
jgi:hypothetical protein